MRRYLLLFLFVSFCTVKLFSQQNYRAGTLTQANVNFSLPRDFKLNTKLEARQIFSKKEPSKKATNGLRYERTDLQLVLTKKVSADNSIGGGYLVRLEDGRFTHRLIQQFNSVRKLEVVTLAHRVVLDESFRSDDPVEIRLRYRLGLEKALNGRSIDPKEFYLKLNNEYLGIFSRENSDLEIRASGAIGYNARDNNKVELGLEYRINEFYTAAKAQQYWLTISWFMSI
ncbi:MAG: DUF2490 domain-containing protein [Chitinophagaceae bacterium]|nr:MAG: DUF2490 domain-containing protein [Chitinophagaceae bacterium]